MSKINVLDRKTAELIAAGEVIKDLLIKAGTMRE